MLTEAQPTRSGPLPRDLPPTQAGSAVSSRGAAHRGGAFCETKFSRKPYCQENIRFAYSPSRGNRRIESFLSSENTFFFFAPPLNERFCLLAHSFLCTRAMNFLPIQ